MSNYFLKIETTYPNIDLAKKLANILLEKKLAACIHFSEIKSCYSWKNNIKIDNEILVTIKSKNSLYKKIEETIKLNHIYEIPQIISSPIISGFDPYLQWIESNIEN